jgi:hypothetical protein
MNCLLLPSSLSRLILKRRLLSPFSSSRSYQRYSRSGWGRRRPVLESDRLAEDRANSELPMECFHCIGRTRILARFWELSRSTGHVHTNHSSRYKRDYFALDDLFVAGEAKITSGLLLFVPCLGHQIFYHFFLQFFICEQTSSLDHWNPQRLELLLDGLIISFQSLFRSLQLAGYLSFLGFEHLLEQLNDSRKRSHFELVKVVSAQIEGGCFPSKENKLFLLKGVFGGRVYSVLEGCFLADLA